ncbi:MAG: hypothetical protein ABS935_05470 [Solibacillus sp.]|uniref:hypothetical protein n=1 Tax=Solibacillus sp. TaxID=1909654 RepID=UPI003315EDBA
MKKYWQLLVIAGVIVLTIGFHYVQVASATKQNYNFTFENISGDDKYIESLLIEASVEKGMGYDNILIHKGGSKVISNPYSRHTPLLFTELIDEHKNFMRGKPFFANNYYEDDSKLVFVKEPYDEWSLNTEGEYSFKVEVLNKAENKKTSFEVPSASKNKLHYMSIINTTVVNNDLKIILKQVKDNGDEELNLVTIDMKNQQLLSESLVDTALGDEKIRRNFDFYNKYNNIGNEKYNVYSVTSLMMGSESAEVISRQFSLINTETNEVTSISLPEGLELDMENGIVDDNYFVASYSTEENTVIHRYNLGQQRWLDPIIASQPDGFVNEEMNNLYAQNSKLYLMNETANDFILQIIDIESGTLLYEGKLLNDNAKLKYNIWVNNFHEQKE